LFIIDINQHYPIKMFLCLFYFVIRTSKTVESIQSDPNIKFSSSPSTATFSSSIPCSLISPCSSSTCPHCLNSPTRDTRVPSSIISKVSSSTLSIYVSPLLQVAAGQAIQHIKSHHKM